mgnify:CR=1 FL=1
MKLYHGSNIVIDQIDLSKCKPYKDFGQGFYLTEIKEQAEQMARRTSAIYGGEPIVTEFEFDETALDTLSIKIFKEPSEELYHVIYDQEAQIDLMVEKMRARNVKRLSKSKCGASESLYYNEILVDLERVGDHALNIADAAKKYNIDDEDE